MYIVWLRGSVGLFACKAKQISKLALVRVGLEVSELHQYEAA